MLPNVNIRLWPNVRNPDAITYAVIQNHPYGSLRKLRNLRAICSIGAGVDYLLADKDLPKDIPIARTVDSVMAQRMTEYVLAGILRFQRRLDRYADLQAGRIWKVLPQKDSNEVRVGILGLGYIGRRVAKQLVQFGYGVAGWSRRPKNITGVRSFADKNGFISLLSGTDILVCLLPLTPETTGIINYKTLSLLPLGACLINCARGAVAVEEDILTALREGRLSAAMLDVFNTEPLPSDHPFWREKNILITPHVASFTNIEAALSLAVENYRRFTSGHPLLNQIDRSVGY